MKLMIVFVFSILLLQNIVLVDGARVLAVFHMPSRSHHILGEILLKALAAKGHQVTMVSPLPLKEPVPNYTDIKLDGMEELIKPIRAQLFSRHNMSNWGSFLHFANITNTLAEKSLKCNAIQKLLASPNEKFDLVIIDAFLNDVFMGLREHFNAPIIALSTSNNMVVNHLTGNVSPYAFVPHAMLKFSDKMTFSQRFINTAMSLMMEFTFKFLLSMGQNRIYKEIFPNGIDFYEAVRNVDLTLINSHILLESPRPYLPNMIQIAGMHVQEPRKLPQDLQHYLDEAKNGVIFFSMGSNLRSTDIPTETREIILNTFKKIPQKVLWKFEETELPGKPDNVKIGKWFPQSDILAHPNVKLFITHGGLLSSIEAVYRGVPIVGMPIFGDQYGNIQNFVSIGFGREVDLENLSEESFTEAILDVLNNPKYRENAKKYSEIINDQPTKPLDRAVFWSEYIIRHKNGKHLRSASVDLSLVQYLLLDIIFVTFATIGIISVGIYLIVKKLCCCSSKRNVQKLKQS